MIPLNHSRYFVTFRQNTSLYNKVMVFNFITSQEAWDQVNRLYPIGVDKVLSEQEFARLMPNLYSQHEVWVRPEHELIIYTLDPKTGSRTDTVMAKYPVHSHPKESHAVTLEPITDWFKVALPRPKEKDQTTQMGAMFEEIAEAISVLKQRTEDTELQNICAEAFISVSKLSNALYLSKGITLDKNQRIELLDALADQVVTCTAVAHSLGFKWDKALSEINRSNFSKFENGKPIFNENGKIMKGKDYFKPNLEEFV